MTTFDFNDGNGPVPAHQHMNGGGWVADTAYVDASAYVGPNVLVYGSARVFDSARIYNNALIYGDALISGNVLIYGDAQVYDIARVSGNARVYSHARVYGHAQIHSNTWVYGNASVFGNALIYGDTRVYGHAVVNKPITSVIRSDGHAFIYVPCADGIHRVIAACRYFTMEEAREHWMRTRGGTLLGDETLAILDYLETCRKIYEDNK